MRYPASSYGAYSGIWQYQRELGFAPPVGARDVFTKSLYSTMNVCAQWDAQRDSDGLMHGGIFNLEFSPDGTILVAACEKNSILMIDPLTYKKIYYAKNAHSDCVNFVKFLDNKMFATCSDDTTVALWDTRNLKNPIRTLQGHSNWVKNIEYSVKDKLLITSGLDGSIYTWDINSYTEWSLVYQRVFHAPGLMRCRISPDASQLIMCTTGGLIIVIHKLDLATLAQDLHGFKPNMYRLMQMTNEYLPIAAMYNHLFDMDRKRNRVEFITDFPKNNSAEVVSSLQIHPQGWCALSRNISHNDKSEWTCVHDIQECDTNAEDLDTAIARIPHRVTRRTTRSSARGRMLIPSSTRSFIIRGTANRTSRRNIADRSNSNPTNRRAAPTIGTNDVWEALITIRQQRMQLELSFRGESQRSFSMQRINGISSGITVPVENDIDDIQSYPAIALNRRSFSNYYNDQEENDESVVQVNPTRLRHIIQNRKRLLYYAPEPNVGQGFIKELCFSADGRLVCSPFGFGVRLLSFTKECSELPNCIPKYGNPAPLTKLWEGIDHEDYVVTAKFNPRHFMLTTGCLSGRIIWYQPRG